MIRTLLSLIRLYKIILSPAMPMACRFTPTCSDYAAEAIKTQGAMKGLLLAGERILRCHPWGKSGYDPVPHNCSLRGDDHGH